MRSKTDIPIVSVITATYKKFDFIYKTIDSVLTQDYPNIEFIITDDGSNNFPEEEIKSYIRKHNIKKVHTIIYHSDKNIGTVRNLNHAYRMSNGKYIFNLSCGDVFFDSLVVERIVNRFINDNCKVIVTRRAVYDGERIIDIIPHSREVNKIIKWTSNLEQYKHFITSQHYDMASGSAMYFDRDVFNEIGYYDESYNLWEDGPFLSKFLWHNSLSFYYDIVSIKYLSGGVSDKNAPINMIYKNDIDYFNNNEKPIHYKQVDFWTKRNIKYSKLRSNCKNNEEVILTYSMYIDQIISYTIYTLKRRVYKWLDRKMFS